MFPIPVCMYYDTIFAMPFINNMMPHFQSRLYRLLRYHLWSRVYILRYHLCNPVCMYYDTFLANPAVHITIPCLQSRLCILRYHIRNPVCWYYDTILAIPCVYITIPYLQSRLYIRAGSSIKPQISSATNAACINNSNATYLVSCWPPWPGC